MVRAPRLHRGGLGFESLSAYMNEVYLGKYRHFKGNDYEVIGIAKLEATLEEMVVYRPLYKSEHTLWVRPLKVFTENVEVDGKMVPRFTYLE